MSNIGAATHSEGIRRSRSEGDIARRPDPAHLRVITSVVASQESADFQTLSGRALSGAAGAGSHLSPLSAPSTRVQWPAPSSALGSQLNVTQLDSPTLQQPGQHGQPDHNAEPQPPMSVSVRVLTYFGLGRRATHARKSLVSMTWNLTWGFFQITVIIVFLILTTTHFKSPTQLGISEFRACDRPLGIWASIWVVRVILASSLAYWEFRRDRLLHPVRADSEGNTAHTGNAVNATSNNANPNGSGASPHNGVHGDNAHELPDPPTLPHTGLYSRLTLLSSLITLSWFLTAHILAYTSINSCRYSSPHLWWLIFGILCIMYLMVLEVVLLGFVVLVVAPILFIFWNIFLICIGRHPMQNPHMIKPEIGKLPKSVVERIPLVVYIPPPPSAANKEDVAQTPHIYPPKASAERKPSHPRFKFLRQISSFGSKGPKKPEKAKTVDSDTNRPEAEAWVDHWEQGEYPFVTLEGNRAACAICLMDFEEPKRKETAGGQRAETEKESTGEGSSKLDASQGATNVAEDAAQAELKLLDAGEGSQPLRLLACGHVFHKICLDPWLIDVSGRCPVCQRPVELSKPEKTRRPT